MYKRYVLLGIEEVSKIYRQGELKIKKTKNFILSVNVKHPIYIYEYVCANLRIYYFCRGRQNMHKCLFGS